MFYSYFVQCAFDRMDYTKTIRISIVYQRITEKKNVHKNDSNNMLKAKEVRRSHLFKTDPSMLLCKILILSSSKGEFENACAAKNDVFS